MPLVTRLALATLALLSIAAAPVARARVEVGATLAPVTLPTLAGGTEPLTSAARANIVLFWRPDQEHSLDTLKQMAACQQKFAGKPIHMVAVVSGTYARGDVKAAVDGAALQVPVLVDEEDALYGKLEIRQHPLVVVTDGAGKVALAQPYTRLRYCDVVLAHVRFLLGEIDAAQLEAQVNPARASFPSDDRNNVARRFVNMGKLEAEDGNCEKARESFRKALEIAPDNEAARAGMAKCAAGASAPRAAAP